MNEQEKILNAIEKLKKAKYCFGICSDTNINDNHVLFFDFDGKYTIDNVIDSLKLIQKVYNLSTVYILESLNGFNAFCLDILPMKDVTIILLDTPKIDPLFVDLGYKKNNRYILRMDLDKKLITTISRKNNVVLSNAHHWFFKNIMNFNIEDNHIYNDSFTFRVVAYKSVKHGYCELYD